MIVEIGTVDPIVLLSTRWLLCASGSVLDLASCFSLATLGNYRFARNYLRWSTLASARLHISISITSNAN